MTRDLLPRRLRSFLDRLYALQRFRLFMGSRAFPPSPSIQPQNLRRQFVALVQRNRRDADAAISADTEHPCDTKSTQWKLDVRTSSIPNAGNGVFLRGSSVPAGTLMTLYPGNVATSPLCTLLI